MKIHILFRIISYIRSFFIYFDLLVHQHVPGTPKALFIAKLYVYLYANLTLPIYEKKCYEIVFVFVKKKFL